ncbi:MAG: hypothetical protein HFF18_08135 [Oscillospiraceae bacterium]|nr:hypothetical protein [Oscillospiraceae bacterium]
MDLVTCVHNTITWAQIGEWSDRYEASTHFEVGDEISDTLKTGEEVVFVVVGKDMYHTRDVIFGLKDCLKTKWHMNTTYTNKGGWTVSNMRRYLNEWIFEQLPDDLQIIIKPRVIQNSLDRLWLFSQMEILGNYEFTEKDTDFDAQMPYFKRKSNRVKGLGKDGVATRWWDRSHYVGNTLSFYRIDAGGGCDADAANCSYGVSFGFCV